jgi:hypothetical protein
MHSVRKSEEFYPQRMKIENHTAQNSKAVQAE